MRGVTVLAAHVAVLACCVAVFAGHGHTRAWWVRAETARLDQTDRQRPTRQRHRPTRRRRASGLFLEGDDLKRLQLADLQRTSTGNIIARYRLNKT